MHNSTRVSSLQTFINERYYYHPTIAVSQFAEEKISNRE